MLETSMRYVENINITALLISIFMLVLVWLYTTIKKIYNRLNKCNNMVPVVSTIKKIIPPHINIGWQVCSVSNSLAIWKYDITFTFAPKNLYCCRVLLQKNSQVVLKELLDVKIFSSLFPNSKKFQVEKGSLKDQQDIISIVCLDSSLSLTSILLTQHSTLEINRKWFSGLSESWLYIHPSNMLLTQIYGYWMCFYIQDIENNSSIFYLIASYPSSKKFNDICSSMSSCLILLKEHIDSISILKLIATDECKWNNSCITAKEVINEPVVNISNFSPTNNAASEDIYSLKSTANDDAKSLKNKEKLKKRTGDCLTEYSNSNRVNETQSSVTINSSDEKSAINSCDKMSEKSIKNKDPIMLTESVNVKESLLKKINIQLSPYMDILHEGFNTMMKVYNADEKTPGWRFTGAKDGVRMFRCDKDEISEAPTFKGTGIIKVPLGYLIQYVSSISFKSEYDKMFESGSPVEIFCDNLTKIFNLKYIGIWPVAGRDFCSISTIRHLKDNMYGLCVKAVEHPDCPPISSRVRGNVLIGGFLLKVLSSNPPETEITYLARVELGGYIPQQIINKISAEQSMFPAVIRKHCERRFGIQDPVSEEKKILNEIHSLPSWFEEKIHHSESTISNVNSIDVNKPQESIITNDTSIDVIIPQESVITNVNSYGVNTFQTESNTLNTHKDNLTDLNLEKNVQLFSTDSSNDDGFSERFSQNDAQGNNLVDDDSQLIDDSQSIVSENSLSSEVVSMKSMRSVLDVSDQQIDLPRDRFGQIDFITLGNQTAASLEEEFCLALHALPNEGKSNAPPNSSSMNQNENFGWIYQGTEKDVTLMKKVHSHQKVHSFFGRGVIHVLPVTVFTAVTNPTVRYMYDNMLKKVTVVRQISERHKIVHMLYETNKCFVKQARDFCVLLSERKEEKRFVLAASSVEVPDCPFVKDISRGKILSSGWIIEPIEKDGKLCSMVTYISQVDFRGRLPSRLINYIGKRQPLGLAYLREYLESSEY